MNNIVDFYLLQDASYKDSTGQVHKGPPTQVLCIGKLGSVYQNEFFKAEQAGLRPQGTIEMSFFDYHKETELLLEGNTYSIYRTFKIGTDKIQLFFGERVGNKASAKPES